MFLIMIFFLTGCQSAGESFPQTPQPTNPIASAMPNATSASDESPTPVAAPKQTSLSLALQGQTWQLVTYVDAQGVTKSPIVDTKITARFSDGQVGGNAGCNQYFAGYQFEGDQLTIQNAGSTLMACVTPEGVMVQEQAFLNRLSEAASYRIRGVQLEILDSNDKTILAFSVEQPISLTGAQWQLDSYLKSTEAVVSPLPGVPVTAIFAADGRLSGKAPRSNAEYHQP